MSEARNRIVAAWSAADGKRALLPADRQAIIVSEPLRMLIVDLLLNKAPDDELFDACASLGRLIAQTCGSPTLASLTLDQAREALGRQDDSWFAPARAALAEGFSRVLVEESQREAMQAWEFPGCTVPLGAGALAVAASHPSEDEEVLAAWAARVANSAALRGIRRATVAGPDRPRQAVVDALTTVGIRVTAT